MGKNKIKIHLYGEHSVTRCYQQSGAKHSVAMQTTWIFNIDEIHKKNRIVEKMPRLCSDEILFFYGSGLEKYLPGNKKHGSTK